MHIPEKFTINTQEIKIEQVDSLPDQEFGKYNTITDVIKIATCVKDDEGTLVKLTEEQILNTLFHEVLHAFQWYATGDTDEIQSSTYAGYILEFLKSTNLIEKFGNHSYHN